MSLLPPRKPKALAPVQQPESVNIIPLVTDRIIRMPEVMYISGLALPTIYKHMALGTFPPKIKITGRASGCKASDMNRWLDGERNFKQEAKL
jgi:prophage regulatory protein